MARHHWLKTVTHYEHSSGFVIAPDGGRADVNGWILRGPDGAEIPPPAGRSWNSFTAAAAHVARLQGVKLAPLPRWRPEAR
jgi:hypothetical protein